MVRHVPYFLLIVPVLLISHMTSSSPFGTQLYCCVHIFYLPLLLQPHASLLISFMHYN
ncbi:hypothetical protein C8F04DRAFT_1131395 [Mycena alexandri]|uniref:NADH dehydrogenase subunit 4 n=1 Tax=Mycena alexandri TaxID=1745969 RepID=A0AAD6SC14_9AGAR|nr:hypothetical protein C8F04DRAFT_1131395 [Mycena alexandri]